jgi:hypothetical protein
MQVLQPLAVEPIGLAAGDVLLVAGVDQADLETARLEETGLIEIAQAAAQPEAIEAGDYTVTSAPCCGQKQLHAAAMMSRPRFLFHPAKLLPAAAPQHGLRVYCSVNSIRISVTFVFQTFSLWLRREPR